MLSEDQLRRATRQQLVAVMKTIEAELSRRRDIARETDYGRLLQFAKDNGWNGTDTLVEFFGAAGRG